MQEDEQAAFEQSHKDVVVAALGDEGVWFNTDVMIVVGER
jgi:hypothetical protein